MDVHAPHQPIHGVKDFFLHLLTITVGLLIAVGIEGCVALHHEHTLVKEARASIREEIEHNVKSMTDAVKTIEANKAEIKKDIDTLTNIQQHPKDKSLQNADIKANFNIQGIHEAAWKTAQSTGALAYMPHQEVQRYTDIYEAHHAFLTQQDKILEDEAKFLGVMAKTNFGHGDITLEQTSAALEPLGVWLAHLSYLDLMAKLSLMSDQAFLDGKDAPSDLHEDLGGK